MKNTGLKLTQALGLLVLAGFASSVHATSIGITFNDDDGGFVGSDYVVEGYVFMGVQINGAAQCDEDDCINFTAQDTFILKREDNEAFSLTSFYLRFQSGNPLLDVNGEEFCTSSELCTGLGLDTAWDDGAVALNGTHFELNPVMQYLFDNLRNSGNIRLDTFELTCEACGNGGGTDVPEPGTLGLLGLGLLGLAARRRRTV